MQLRYLIIAILLIMTSCTRHLSDSEAEFMPYEIGDKLVFQNLENGSTSTISITDVRQFVPDGEQIYFNETIVAYRKNNNPFIILSAGYAKYSDPYLEIRGFWGGKQYLSEIDQQPKKSLTTKHGTFNDVVVFESKEDTLTDVTQTVKIYWSIENGIVKYENSDNTIWQLLDLKHSVSPN